MIDRLVIALADALQRRANRRARLSFTDTELALAVAKWQQEADA